MRHVEWLPDDEEQWSAFRLAVRRCLAAGRAPETIAWHTRASGAEDLFASAHADADAGAGAGKVDASRPDAFAPDPGTAPVAAREQRLSCRGPSRQGPSLRVPRAMFDECALAVRHRDPARFGLMYRWLWRLAHAPALRDDPIDEDRLAIGALARAVRQEVHRMTAFIRFRPLAREGQPPMHIAWFEPEHRILAAAAPFFVRRFATIDWSILTPRSSAHWDRTRLVIGPGASRADVPALDAGDELWLAYFASTFNPARLNLALQRREMPRRYWPALPEAALITPLAHAATTRAGAMLAAGPTAPRRSVTLQPMPRQQRLDAMGQAMQRCRDCPIGAGATQAVPGEGPLNAPLMLVGEQPGNDEDLQGRPFVGPAGRLLDRALAELGWPRERLYVTNAVRHFKYELRGKRRIHKTPAQREVEACHRWLDEEIALVRPAALVALGATAARALLGPDVSVMRDRGQWQTAADGRPVLVTLHPSAILRSEADDPDAYRRWVADLAHATRFLDHDAQREEAAQQVPKRA